MEGIHYIVCPYLDKSTQKDRDRVRQLLLMWPITENVPDLLEAISRADERGMWTLAVVAHAIVSDSNWTGRGHELRRLCEEYLMSNEVIHRESDPDEPCFDELCRGIMLGY
jgi:hypothetical protein